jgi:3-dehydroquinate dehydratase-1
MPELEIRGSTIGTGTPKVIVPIVGKTQHEILADATQIIAIVPDLIEWRADFYDNVLSEKGLIDTLGKLRAILQNVPLIFTIRTSSEGGNIQISDKEYSDLLKFVANTGDADIIDVELFRCEGKITELVDAIHDRNNLVIMSNHDFHATPEKSEIVARLRKMQDAGGDLLKIAVMPQTTDDVIVLMDATNEMVTNYAKKPLVTMSMGGLGAISRLAGEVFGSSMTFGSVGKKSAPGQIPVSELKLCLKTIRDAQSLG